MGTGEAPVSYCIMSQVGLHADDEIAVRSSNDGGILTQNVVSGVVFMKDTFS